MSYPCLKNKVVLITGASSGIGRATAVHFASLGSKLVLSGRKDSALQETVSQCKGAGDVITIVGDLTIESDVVRIIEKTIEHYKQLDVLVNNAGILDTGGIESSSLKQFDSIMGTNVRAVYHITMLAVPHLIATKGAIVNVSSISGMVGSSRSLAYSMSKSMIDQFTRCVALDLAPKQVRVNSVNPGIILTEMVRNIVPAEHLDAFMRETYKIYPLGKVAEAVDVAKMIAFLASSECSFTTGTRNTVDSGFHVACPR